MDPVLLISLCPRWCSACGSIDLRQAGKFQMKDKDSRATLDTKETRVGGCMPELPHPTRDTFQLYYTMTQGVPSRTGPSGGVLLLRNLYWLSLLPFPPSTFPIPSTCFLRSTPNYSTYDKIPIWRNVNYAGAGLRNSILWTHMPASSERWPSLEKEVEEGEKQFVLNQEELR